MASDLKLPLNFPMTFLPDRNLLVRLLDFAAQKGSGDKVSISEATGIPTGASTGKVEPMIYYAYGMGLVNADKSDNQWQLELTPLGQHIRQEDPFLSELQTLWLLHLLLCHRLDLNSPATGVSDAWFTLFTSKEFKVGKPFELDDFYRLLVNQYGEKSYLKSLSGVVIRAYQEESCLGSIRVVSAELNDQFQRTPAPDEISFYPVFACYLFLIWDALFASDTQIALDFFCDQSLMFEIMGWDDSKIQRWLSWMSDKGFLQVDRYTGSPMLLRLCDTEKAISLLYSELV